MEAAQIEKIKRRLPQIIKNTTCSAPFLLTFIQGDIFSFDDMMALESEKNTLNQTKRFHELIQTRVGSYVVLLEALRNTNQTGVLAMLNDKACDPNIERCKTTNYINPPKYLADFLNGANNTLVIHTSDCEITRDRIIETVENVTEFTPENYIRSIPGPSANSSCIKEGIPLINCQLSISCIQYAVAYPRKKVVLVPNIFSKEIQSILLRTQCKDVRHEDDILEWEDLHPTMKMSVEETLKSFQLPIHCNEIISNLKGKVLFDLIKGNKPTLFKDTIPPKITYYIPRRLISRNVISKKVFQKFENDLFLIKGIERHELTRISNGQETDTSNNLLQKGVCDATKLALLEYEPDYETIVKKVGATRPVHVIEFKQDKFLWVKSSGGIGILQRAVSTSQNIQREDEFIDEVVNSSTKERGPICISDSPGMGKSILLAELARKLQEKLKHYSWSVAFVVISELVENTKKFANQPDLSEHMLLSLARIICENELGVVYFQKCKNLLTNLLLDGLDEVQSQDIDFAYKLLNLLRKILPSARIWVTTRPHMFPKLEKAFNVLGYNIKAFQEEDQAMFLKRYWTRERRESDFDSEILETYIKKCLSSLKCKINSTKEHDIAGIPLQCLLIGEAFEDDAVRFCTINDHDIPAFCIKSITDLYELVVKKKFDKFHTHYDKGKKYEDADLEREHIYYSIFLLFPTFHDEFVTEFPSCPIPLETIFNVGILEYKAVLSSPRFIHRTFAEYFVAKFVIDGLYFSNLSNSLLNLLFTEFLKTKYTQHKFAAATFDSQKFLYKYNIICYFINSFMGTYGDIKCKDELSKKCSTFNLNVWKGLCEGCGYSGFEHIFQTLICDLPAIKPFEKEIFTEEFVAVFSAVSDAAIVARVYEIFTRINGKLPVSIVFQGFSLIQLAVIRGNYKVFEKNAKMVEQISPPTGKACWELIRLCIDESQYQSESIIKEKVNIIKYLLSLKRAVENSSTFNMYSQKLPSTSHIALTTELIQCTKLSVDQIINFLHKATTQGSCKEYKNLLQTISAQDASVDSVMCAILNTKENGWYLIELILKNMYPSLELLEVLNKLGLNFSKLSKFAFMRAVNERRCSNEALAYLLQTLSADVRDGIFQSIINENDSIDTLAELTNYARPAQMDTSANTLLHLACCNTSHIKRRLELIKQLIDKGADVNAQNKNKNTPLDLLLSEEATTEGFQILELLKSSCGNDHQQVFAHKINWTAKHHEKLKFADYADIRLALAGSQPRDRDGNTLLHIVVKTRDYAMLEHLVSLGADVNAKNKGKETPLHILSKMPGSNFESWKVLIDNGADPLLHDVDGNTSIHHLNRYCYEANTIQFITYVMNRELQLDLSSPKVEETFLLALSVFKHTVVKSLSEWFVENVKKPLNNIQGCFRRKQATVLDAVLHNSDGDVLEYILVTHKCSVTLKPFGSVWFHSVLTKNVNESSKYLKLVNELFPDLKNTPNEDGVFPLSTKGIRERMAKTLVQLGANVNAVDKSGNTPLHCAIRNDSENSDDLVDLLIKHGADLNAVTANGETPLSLSMNHSYQYRRERCFKCLIKHGADVSRTDSFGNTILHLLPSNIESHVFHAIVSLFLEEGYKDLFHFVNTNNQTPIQLFKAKFNLQTKTVNLLKEYGLQV